MENILSESLIEKIHTLGEEIKSDPRAAVLKAAADKYNNSSELRTLITEYNVQQEALSEEYAKENHDEAVTKSIEARINELYENITGSAVYSDYVRAKDEYDAFYSEICSELEFVVTGSRPCSHDCSGCHGCH